jgi:predicted ATPase
MQMLEQITIENFKSIRRQSLVLGPLNLFIGGNGAGKSNFIGAFRLLREIANQNLEQYTAIKGGADSLLYFGRRQSPKMSFRLTFSDSDVPSVSHGYNVGLSGTDDGSLNIADEFALYHERDKYPAPYFEPVSLSQKESGLQGRTHICVRKALDNLASYRVYHFHDTGDTAPAKAVCDVEDNRFLRPQAENLAAFLYWLQEKKPGCFSNIQDAIRQIAPFFDGFRLAPSLLNESKIRLEWTEKGSDAYFNANALSDGTLRFICLATLLLQPDPPPIILLDEPELGLHPAAINLLAALLQSAATRTQIIVATQSVTLVDQFTPEEVWTVDREDNQSVFRHLAKQDLGAWLDGYSLGELWQKNIFGGRP